MIRPSLLRGAAAEPCRPCLRRLLHAGAAWRQRQQRDPYVREAARLGYRSRAAFKLLEMDAKKRLLREGGVALDLGAAPGSWTQQAGRPESPRCLGRCSSSSSSPALAGRSSRHPFGW